MSLGHDKLLELASKLKSVELPGETAHQVFYTSGMADRNASLMKNDRPRLSSVAAILAPIQGFSNVVLIKRPQYQGVHSGQMALPGGKAEKEDENLLATALRETEEEVGVHRTKLEFIRPMTEVYIPPSGFLVYPHLFMANEELSFSADPREVAEIVLLPVNKLLEDSTFVQGSIYLEQLKGKMKTRYFEHDGHVIWGATALMLNELKMMLQRIEE